ncbi:MAG TPA: phosphotransferase [Ktedonobacterales bacterium]|jgi:aminoglycoside 2''-phosphotransferase
MDAAFYQQMLEASVPGLRVETCKLHLSGWDSVALEVNDALIFRFPRPNRPDVEAQYEVERALLPELVQALPLPVPQFLYVGDGPPGSGRRFVGYRKIAGVELRAGDLAAAQPERVARQLAEFLSCLHTFPVERAAQLNVPGESADDWRREYQTLYRRVCDAVLPLLEAPARAQAVALWERFLTDDAHFAFRPALIHRDLSSDHILYDAASGALAGIIDWGDVFIGDPAMDFVGLLGEYGRAFAEATLAGYRGEQDATFWQRMNFYLKVVPFHEVLFGARQGDEAHIRRGVQGVEQALARQ